MTVDAIFSPSCAAGALRVGYFAALPEGRVPDDALAIIGFGRDALLPDDARALRIGLEPAFGNAPLELWHGAGPARTGSDGAIRYAEDGHHLFAVLEIDEREAGGIEAAAETAYAMLREFQQKHAYGALLRIWNYFDAINRGAGDNERYRRFCNGRARGLNLHRDAFYPAATAIGRRDGDPRLQVYWLAARAPGLAIENPRQVSAYRYPREYGPTSPSFSRAMACDDGTLLISGTASVIGHRTAHAGMLSAQLEETLRNLEAVVCEAHRRKPIVAATLGAHSLLKVYLRDANAAPEVRALLQSRLDPATPWLLVIGDICRADLAIEIDAAHLAGAPKAR